MKRSLFLILPVLGLLFSGCVTNLGPGGAMPGLFYTDVNYPNALNPDVKHEINFEREDIDILGPVTTKVDSSWYFFVVSSGDSGYAKLMEQVREAGGDGVMNLTVDTKYENYFIFYANVETTLSGVAYRYKR